MKDRVLPDGIISPFKMKPKIAIIFGFVLLFLLLLGDYLSPDDYRLVSLYIFPAALISLNARSLWVVVLAVGVATLFENYNTFVQHNFTISFTQTDIANFLFRFSSTVLIVWLTRALRRSQLRVNLLANTDSLSGLWNRRWARLILDQQIAKLAVSDQPLTVALIDLNDFKKINDTRGHLVGDQALVRVSQLFLGFATPFITFFRLGGDEFLMVMEGFDEHSSRNFLVKLTERIDAAMLTEGFPITLSVGSATYHQPPISSSEILHQVDEKMYERKMAIKAAML
jgi:diguanylate cyclase (GGDEF)-like protein